MVRTTRPGILRSISNHAGTDRVPLYISKYNTTTIRIKRVQFVAVFPDFAALVVFPVIVLRVPLGQEFHEGGYAFSAA